VNFSTHESLLEAAFDAIKYLHAQMDDDHSGSVDLAESSGFIKEELSQSNGKSRQSNFHAGNDDQITVLDLWEKFRTSPISEWKVDEVVTWLVECAASGGGSGSDKYELLFRERDISGLHLALIAANKDHFFNKFFGRNVFAAEDKKRLILKAQDAVLFGPCKRGINWIKDVLLFIACGVIALVMFFAHRQQTSYNAEMEQLQRNIDSLTSAEKDLESLQERLAKEENARKKLDEAKARDEREKSERERELANTIDAIRREAEEQKRLRLQSEATAERLEYAEAELLQVRTLLKRAERQLEERQRSGASSVASSLSSSIPSELIDLLAETYRREMINYARKKADAEQTLANAKEYLDKVRKKKNSVLGNIRLAHSGNMDEVDAKMRDAKLALEEVREDLKERRLRWHQIELTCGVSFAQDGGRSLQESRRNLGSGSMMSLASSRLNVSMNNNTISGAVVEEEGETGGN